MNNWIEDKSAVHANVGNSKLTSQTIENISKINNSKLYTQPRYFWDYFSIPKGDHLEELDSGFSHNSSHMSEKVFEVILNNERLPLKTIK